MTALKFKLAQMHCFTQWQTRQKSRHKALTGIAHAE